MKILVTSGAWQTSLACIQQGKIRVRLGFDIVPHLGYTLSGLI